MIKDSKQPQMAKFTTHKVMIKDHNYYKGQEISWNNPAHIDEKIFNQYHRQYNEKRGIIEKQLEQQVQFQSDLEAIRRRNILKMRIEDRSRYNQRVQERTLVEDGIKKKGYYGVSLMDLDSRNEAVGELIAKKADTYRHHRLNENIWNCQNLLSEKRSKQFLTPATLKGEEHMLQTVKKAIYAENLEEEKKKNKMEECYQEIKDSFDTQRKQNKKTIKTLQMISGGPTSAISLTYRDISDHSQNIVHTHIDASNNPPATHRPSMSIVSPIDEYPLDNMSISSHEYKGSFMSARLNTLSIPKRVSEYTCIFFSFQ